MDLIASIRMFVAVAERRGFAAAAQALDVAPATVTKYVASLERHLGARLLHRTTRKLSLTESGRLYLERCTRVLEELAAAESLVSREREEPHGRLRVNAAHSFGTLYLGPVLADYLRRYPRVEVDLTLMDRRVDLIEEGYDVAIRIGVLEDSALVARRLAPVRMLACASPAYLKARGRPQRPEQLATHDCLLYTYNTDAGTWKFTGADGVETAVQVAGSLRANNGDVLLAAAMAGAGIILQPTFIVGPAVADGRLVPILEGWCASEFGVHAVYPRREFLPAKARTFVDFLAAKFAGTPPWEIGCPAEARAASPPAAAAKPRRIRR